MGGPEGLMFAQTTDDKRDFILGNLRIGSVRPETQGVEFVERLLRQFEPARLAANDCVYTVLGDVNEGCAHLQHSGHAD